MLASKRRPAAFIDRDGVINEELNYVYRIEDFRLVPGAVEGMRCLVNAGFALVVVTNQAGIAKGRYTEQDFQALTRYMMALLAEQGVQLLDVLHCPHHPEGRVPPWNVNCNCRKPAPGMLLEAAHRHELDLRRSILIGDKPSDTRAGRAVGIARTVLVCTGHLLPEDAHEHCDHIAPDLPAAAGWIVKELCKTKP
jgi:D-glycero-D-manno-heptose 1,7-bisphosphate phosphatase